MTSIVFSRYCFCMFLFLCSGCLAAIFQPFLTCSGYIYVLVSVFLCVLAIFERTEAVIFPRFWKVRIVNRSGQHQPFGVRVLQVAPFFLTKKSCYFFETPELDVPMEAIYRSFGLRKFQSQQVFSTFLLPILTANLAWLEPLPNQECRPGRRSMFQEIF